MLPPETPKPKFRQVISENIPENLKSIPQWGVWREEKRGKKVAKVPYNLKTGKHASINNPDHWFPFETAINAFENGPYNGINFNVTEENGLVAFDFDDCVNPDTGEIEPEVKQFLEILQSASEKSPSNTGVRAFAFGTVPGTRNKLPEKGYEIYTKKKVLTVTGHAIDKRPVEHRPAECKQIYELIFGVEKPPEPVYQPQPPMMITDTDLLEKMFSAANGGKTQTLYNGDICDHPSHSEADMALCSALAFWTGRDEERMDRLFRSSGLMRDKWNRKTGSKTYGQLTIQKAARNCTKVYEPKPQYQERTPVSQSPAKKTPQPQKNEPSEKWDNLNPIPVDRPNLPTITPDMLPQKLRAICQAKAQEIQVDITMCVTAALVALAASSQGKIFVRPIANASFMEALALYLIAASSSGDRKSSVNKFFRSPFDKWEAEQVVKQGPERLKALSRYRTWQEDVEAKRKERKTETDPIKKVQIAKKIEELESKPPEVPDIPKMLVDDATPEALAEAMARQNEIAALFEAEGGLVKIMDGLYAKKGKGNINVWLKGHTGDSIIVDRVGKGRDRIHLKAPYLSLFLCPQQYIVKELGGNKEFRDSGLCARFLYTFPEPQFAFREPESIDAAPEIDESYHAMIRNLLDFPFQFNELKERIPTVLDLSGEARNMWKAFFIAIRDEFSNDPELSHIQDFASKMQGQVLRIAGLLHLSEYGPYGSPEIDEDIMRQAIQLCQVFIHHSRYAFGFMNASNHEKLAKDVLKWIIEENAGKKKPNKPEEPLKFTGRDCLNRFRGRKLQMETHVLPALEALEDALCIVSLEPENARGRRQSLFEVNPKVFEKKGFLLSRTKR